MMSLSMAVSGMLTFWFMVVLLRSDFRKLGVDLPEFKDYSGIVISSRRRIVLSAVLTVTVSVGLIVVHMLTPQAYGLPLVLLPGIAVLAGLIAFAAYPSPVLPEATLRVASLERRGIASYLSAKDLMIFIGAAIGAVTCLIAFGASGSEDSDGLSRMLTRSDAYGMVATSPYPGWYYSGPLLAVTALLVLCSALALHRVAAAPGIPNPHYRDADRYWRTISAKVIVSSSEFAMACYMMGIFAGASVVTYNVSLRSGARSMVVHNGDGMLAMLELGIAVALFITAIVIMASMAARFSKLRIVRARGNG